RLLAGTSIMGKLTAIDADGDVKKFTVQVSNTTREIDKDAQKKYDDVYKRYMTAYQKRDTKTVQKLGPELQQAQKALYVTKDNPIEFQFVGDKEIKVRRMQLPPKEVDGKKVPYTPKEQAELKGSGDDAKLIGYAATLKDLETDGYVRVYLDKSKKTAPKKDTEKSESDKKDADKSAKGKDKSAADSDTPITMIIMVPKPPEAQSAPGGAANPFGKDKKN